MLIVAISLCSFQPVVDRVKLIEINQAILEQNHGQRAAIKLVVTLGDRDRIGRQFEVLPQKLDEARVLAISVVHKLGDKFASKKLGYTKIAKTYRLREDWDVATDQTPKAIAIREVSRQWHHALILI